MTFVSIETRKDLGLQGGVFQALPNMLVTQECVCVSSCADLPFQRFPDCLSRPQPEEAAGPGEPPELENWAVLPVLGVVRPATMDRARAKCTALCRLRGLPAPRVGSCEGGPWSLRKGRLGFLAGGVCVLWAVGPKESPWCASDP